MFITIVGSDGKNGDLFKLNKSNFYSTQSFFEHEITKLIEKYNLEWKDINLVSGGASWIDQIAVNLYINKATEIKDVTKRPNLTLFLCEEFSVEKEMYTENAQNRTSKYLNSFHSKFKEKSNIKSLSDISRAVKLGAKIVVRDYEETVKSLGATDFVYCFNFLDNITPNKRTDKIMRESSAPNKIEHDIRSG